MLRALTSIVVLLVLAAPARAARAWEDPVPIADPAPIAADAALAQDGTLATAWIAGDGRVGAMVDGHASGVLGTTDDRSILVAVAPQAGVVAWSVNGTDGLERTVAAFATAGGSFSAPVDVGAGRAIALRMNAAGDAAIELDQTVTASHGDVFVSTPGFATAFGPAGGSFGAPVQLPATRPQGFALGPSGETVIGMAPQGASGFEVLTRDRGGALSTPANQVAATVGSVAVDAGGRVLAGWADNSSTIHARVRAADGTWGPITSIPAPATAYSVTVATTDAGQGVIAWRDGNGLPKFGTSPLRVSTGSLADGAFAAPATIDTDDGDAPTIATAGDHTVIATTAAQTHAVHVIRRDGTGAFAQPEVAGCYDPTTFPTVKTAGVQTSGATALLIGTSLVRDSDTPSATVHACRVAEPARTSTARYSTTPVFAGEPVTLSPDVRRADYDLAGDQYGYDLDGDGAIDHAYAGSSIEYAFPRPGIQHWSVATQQTSRFDLRVATPFFDTFALDVFARPTLTAPAHIRRRKVLRRGVRVHANAMTGSEPQSVTLKARSGGRTVGSRTLALGNAPASVSIRLTHPVPHGARIQISLRQAGKALVHRAVRVG